MIELTETESIARLGSAVHRPEGLTTGDVDDAVAFVEAVPGRRVVAKASGIAHKTEGGLVRLALDGDGVRECFAELAAAGDGRVVVAEMVPTDVELIVGGTRDPVFGAVVTLGAGGIAAEADPDVVAILAPPEPGDVAAALGSLRMAPLLGPWRGRTPLDIDAMEVLVAAVADILDSADVLAVDVNPVAVVDGTPIVLDALVVLDDGAAA